MVLEYLGATKLFILMGMGAFFALAGLYIMLRPRHTTDETRIEAFGLKFNAASGGVLVFLIGAAFLAVPLFVPERREVLPPSTPGMQDRNGSSVSTGGGSSSTHTAVVLPLGADTAEQEPNNSMHEANQIESGFFYSGDTNPERNDKEDWFVLPTSGIANVDIKVQVRNIDSESFCEVAAFDDKEVLLKKWYFAERGASSYADLFVASSQFVLIRISSGVGGRCKYELKVD